MRCGKDGCPNEALKNSNLCAEHKALEEAVGTIKTYRKNKLPQINSTKYRIRKEINPNVPPRISNISPKGIGKKK